MTYFTLLTAARLVSILRYKKVYGFKKNRYEYLVSPLSACKVKGGLTRFVIDNLSRAFYIDKLLLYAKLQFLIRAFTALFLFLGYDPATES